MSNDKIELKAIQSLVEECIKNNKNEFLANLIYILQQNYKELASLATDGNYHDGWSHTQVLDHITYETR